MKYVDEFRDRAAVEALVTQIRREATQRWTVMEVCGGQTHSLLRHGIDEALRDVVELIHGPGCPVCVTHTDAIDAAIELAKRPGVMLTTFGDMLRVPGSHGSLAAARAAGARIRAVYSPLDALELAARHPGEQIVFFAVGFETTIPATALAVLHAHRRGINNFSLLAAHVRVLPAMETIMKSPECRVQAFLAAGHVCSITGYASYEHFCQQYRVPVVVTGFEPVDLLSGISACINQLEQGRCQADNRYTRSVQLVGNPHAMSIVDEVFESCDQAWRGMGLLPNGGYRLRARWSSFDAAARFPLARLPIVEPSSCLSGDVLRGRIKPPQCPAFGTSCTPEHPMGAPMVSSEGACAAYFHYQSAAVEG